MRYLIIFFAICVTMLMINCRDKKNDCLKNCSSLGPIVQSYVQRYVKINNLDSTISYSTDYFDQVMIDQFAIDVFDIYFNDCAWMAIHVSPGSTGWSDYQNPCYIAYKSNEENYLEFLELAEKHNDMSFNKPVGLSFHHTCIDDTIVKIDLISVNDYDNLHGPGSSLSDIVKIYYFSAEEYVKNNYLHAGEYTCGINVFQLESPGDYREMKLSDFNECSHELVSIYIRLNLTSPPSMDGQYGFEVHLTQQSDATDALMELVKTLGPVSIKGDGTSTPVR